MYNKYHFPNKKPHEEILFFLRRHWLMAAKIIFTAVVLFAISLFFYLFLRTNTTILENPAYAAIYLLLNSAYLLFVLLLTFSSFIDYYLDVWIVTNMRVIGIKQTGLFSREVSEKDLGRMQEITSEVKGVFATFFRYGDIHIQTAAEDEHFLFEQVPHAEDVTRKISNLVDEYRRHNPEIVGDEPHQHSNEDEELEK
jgi:hypothetical protein